MHFCSRRTSTLTTRTNWEFLITSITQRTRTKPSTLPLMVIRQTVSKVHRRSTTSTTSTSFSTISPTKLNEAHFSYTRELRPRAATPSSVPADTAMGFATSFRFGHPFFLNPTIDELIWRTHAKDNFSIIHGSHTLSLAGNGCTHLTIRSSGGSLKGAIFLTASPASCVTHRRRRLAVSDQERRSASAEPGSLPG